MAIEVKSILPRFGAEISGIDIARPLDAETTAAVRAAVDTWGVCVFRDTGLDDESHIAFSRIFGHLELAPSMPGRRGRFQHRELFDAGNITADGTILQDEAMILHKRGDRLWHTDSSFMEVRSAYSLLLAHEVPSSGGETWFADTRSAYEDLPADMKARIAGLELEHSLWWSRKQAGVPIDDAEIDRRTRARHPLVLHHERSGRDALYVAAHARDVVGMPREEGQALIRDLMAFATGPSYVFSVKWRPGDLVIWDNLASMHRGGDFDERHERRDMRRTTVREDGLIPSDEDPFNALFASAISQGK